MELRLRLFVWLSIVWLVQGSAALAAKPPYADLCHRGQNALSQGAADSAFYYFGQAYRQGMPADSLYYFWGQAYLLRGVYDSALALNYATKGSGGGRFRRRVLEQRLLIFRALGWEREAREVGDSLRALPGYIASFFVPTVSLRASGGFWRGIELVDTTFPWGHDDDDGVEAGSRFDYSGGVKIRWALPFLLDGKVGVGAEGNASKPSSPDSSVLGLDSMNVSAGGFIDVRGLGNRLSGRYALKARRDFMERTFIVHSVTLAFLPLRTGVPLVLSAGYTVEKEREEQLVTQSAWGYGSARLAIGKQGTLDLSAVASGYFADPVTGVYDTLRRMYVENADSALPIFYTNPGYSVRLDTTGIGAMPSGIWPRASLAMAIVDAAAGNILVVDEDLPQSVFRIAPGISYSRRLPWKVTGSVGIGWEFAYYLEKTVWYTTVPEIHTVDFVAYDRVSGRYYVLGDRFRLDDEVVVTGTPPVLEPAFAPAPWEGSGFVKHAARRIDNTLSVDLSLERRLGRAVQVRVAGTVGRTWSSMPANAPVDIPVWTGTARLSLSCELPSR